MRILIVGPFANDGLSMKLYTAWLMRILSARGHRVRMVAPTPVFAHLRTGGRLGKYLGYIDKFLLFPLRLLVAVRFCDLVHIPDQGYAMYRHLLGRHPHLITCHDVHSILAARGEYAMVSIGWTGRILQRWILSGLRAASNVLCVSQKTGDDLRRLCDKHTPRIHIVPNALSRDFKPGGLLTPALAVRAGLKNGEEFLLNVGSSCWYKNRVFVLRLFALLIQLPAFSRMRLVMAGRPLNEAEHRVMQEEKIADRVVELADVADAELCALYGQAEALLFPSLAEGFGWPILEAQACGCLVITSDLAPMTDVAGDAAIFVDPCDGLGAAAQIAWQWPRKDVLRQRGFENLRRFDQVRIAEQYCALLESVGDTRTPVSVPVLAASEEKTP